MNKELIELITDSVSEKNEVETGTIYEACEARGFVRGTYTSYISMMKKAGYLRRVKDKVYAIGRPASARTIALNLQRLILHKKGIPAQAPRNTPKQPKAIIEPQTSGEEVEPIQVKIKNAIDLLKSNGYKILAKKTEYTEI